MWECERLRRLAWLGGGVLALTYADAPANAQTTCAPQISVGSGQTVTNSSSINDNPRPGPPACNYNFSAGPVVFAGSNSTFFNTGTVTAQFGQVIGGSSGNNRITGANLVLNNSGVLQYTGANAGGIGVIAFQDTSNVTVNNLAGASILVASPIAGTSPSIELMRFGHVNVATLNNAGTISSNSSEALISFGTQNLLINNQAGGVISYNGPTAHSAIVVVGNITGTGLFANQVANNVLVQNAGVISSNTGPAFQLLAGSTSAAVVGTGTSNVTINNSGQMIGSANAFGVGTIIIARYDSTADTNSLAGQVNIPGLRIDNSGLIDGAASGIAIDNSRNIASSIINSSGSILGNIMLGSGGDRLTFTGGSFQGTVIGQRAVGEVVRFDPGLGGVVSVTGSISNVSLIDFASGTTNFAATGGAAHIPTSFGAMRLGAGAVAAVSAASTVSFPSTSTLTTVITGNGNTTGAGSTNLGRMTATGGFSFLSGTTVIADLSRYSAISNGARYLLAAGGSTASVGSVSTLSTLPIYQFALQRGDALGQSANDVYLVASINPGGQSVVAPQPQVAQALDTALKTQTFDVANQAIGMLTGQRVSGKVDMTPEFGIWTSGRLAQMQHSGFQVSGSLSGGAPVRGASTAFGTQEQSYMAAAQLDVGKWLQYETVGWRMGLFGGYGETSIAFKSNATLQALGITKTGTGSNETAFAGLYSLASVGSAYGLLTVTGAMGQSKMSNPVLMSSGKYDTHGVVGGALAGYIVPLWTQDGEQGGSRLGLDLRAGVSYSFNQGDAFTDSLGTKVSDTVLQSASGIAAAKLFYAYNDNNMRLSPFVQFGYANRFRYDNAVSVGATKFSFEDARDTFSASTGVDFSITEKIQMNVNARGDKSADQTTYSGSVGAKIILN